MREGEELAALGVQALLLFGIPEEKDEEGSGAWNEDGIVQRALRELRPRFPELVLLTDVCLCEYTSHGHCGVLEDGEVDNDASLELLARTAVSPRRGRRRRRRAERHDGRPRRRDPRGARRRRPRGVPILAYAAKYASAFYGPFREAAGSAPSFGDRRGYQMDPANVREALREMRARHRRGRRRADGEAGAAVPRRDPRRARPLRLPLAAYNVSGEYAMVKAAAAAGWLDEQPAALESLTAIRRAGADFVISYWTKELASWL